MDEPTFQSIRLPAFIFACRACGQLHAWTQAEAWVQRAEAADGWGGR